VRFKDGTNRSFFAGLFLVNDVIPLVGDYDRDPNSDFVLWSPSTGGFTIYQSCNNYNTSVYKIIGQPGDIPVAIDYDGDGKNDYAVWRPSNGTWYIIDSSTAFMDNYVHYNIQWGTQGDIPVAGDYNGDGTTELAVWRPSNGMWYVKYKNDSVPYPPPLPQQWGMQGDIPVPGDYDGDYKTDFAVWRPSNGTWYILNQVTVLACPKCGDREAISR